MLALNKQLLCLLILKIWLNLKIKIIIMSDYRSNLHVEKIENLQNPSRVKSL